MTTRIFFALLLPFFMGLAPLEAAVKISCSHPELCRLAKVIFTENNVSPFEFESLVNIQGDPHEFEPSMTEIKNLIKAEILITGPVELNPWIKKINYQRSKMTSLKTINLPLDKKDYALYPATTNDALSHFWLYPKIFCIVKNQMESEFINLGYLSTPLKNKSCAEENKKISSALQATLKKLALPIVLTHDALQPLLESLSTKKGSEIVAVKGSGHHQEASPQSVKKLYDALNASKVVWIMEEKINIPQNILSKKRPGDLIVKIDTANSNGMDYFQILSSLNQKLEALIP